MVSWYMCLKLCILTEQNFSFKGCCLCGAGGGGFLAAITNQPDKYDAIQQVISTNSVSNSITHVFTDISYIFRNLMILFCTKLK